MLYIELWITEIVNINSTYTGVLCSNRHCIKSDNTIVHCDCVFVPSIFIITFHKITLNLISILGISFKDEGKAKNSFDLYSDQTYDELTSWHRLATLAVLVLLL